MISELLQWQFAWPWLLWAIPLPWLTARLLPAVRSDLDSALKVPFAAELNALTADSARVRRTRFQALTLLAWLLLCVAAARPQLLGEITQPPQSGRDLLLAVDLSGSMAAEDMQLGGRMVDRLTAVKAVLGDFLERRAGDRVGLVLFGERAYAVTPLTLDRNSVRQQLFDSVIGLAGTVLGVVALVVECTGQECGANQVLGGVSLGLSLATEVTGIVLIAVGSTPRRMVTDNELHQPMVARPTPDVVRNDCPDAAATLVYVITTDNELFSFYPPDASFRLIGRIACPAPPRNEPASGATSL